MHMSAYNLGSTHNKHCMILILQFMSYKKTTSKHLCQIWPLPPLCDSFEVSWVDHFFSNARIRCLLLMYTDLGTLFHFIPNESPAYLKLTVLIYKKSVFSRIIKNKIHWNTVMTVFNGIFFLLASAVTVFLSSIPGNFKPVVMGFDIIICSF